MIDLKREMETNIKRVRTEEEVSRPTSTSQFKKNDLDALCISFQPKSKREMWDQIKEYDAPAFFDLQGRDFTEYSDLRNAEREGEYTREEKTLIRHLSRIKVNEDVSSGTRESNTDSMVNYLLTKLELNEYPCSLRLQQLFSFDVKEVSIASVPEFCIEHGMDVVLIDEDKHFKNARPGSQWGECQIAGEMLAVACSNQKKQYMGKSQARSIETIYAIRVIGTRFTFYRSDIQKTYIDSLDTGDISEGMLIYRYPGNNKKDEAYSHWDYLNPDERPKIIEALFQIKLYIDSLPLE